MDFQKNIAVSMSIFMMLWYQHKVTPLNVSKLSVLMFVFSHLKGKYKEPSHSVTTWSIDSVQFQGCVSIACDLLQKNVVSKADSHYVS